MKRILLVVLVVALLLVAVAAPAFAKPAHGESAYGKGIIAHCDASHGQLVSAAQPSGVHGEGWVPAGAKGFASAPLAVLEAHGCVFDS